MPVPVFSASRIIAPSLYCLETRGCVHQRTPVLQRPLGFTCSTCGSICALPRLSVLPAVLTTAARTRRFWPRRCGGKDSTQAAQTWQRCCPPAAAHCSATGCPCWLPWLRRGAQLPPLRSSAGGESSPGAARSTGIARLAQPKTSPHVRASLRQAELAELGHLVLVALARLSWGLGGCRAPACGCGARTLTFCSAPMGS